MDIAKPYLLSLLEATAAEHGLPCVDPIRTGVGPIVDRLERLAPA